MRTSVPKMTAALFLFLISILIFTSLQAGAAESSAAGSAVKNPEAVAKDDALTQSDSESFLFKESAFREFFKHGKNQLKSFEDHG